MRLLVLMQRTTRSLRSSSSCPFESLFRAQSGPRVFVISALLASLTSAGCHRPLRWALDPNAPLAPAIHFVEPVGPRQMAVVLLDAHSGEPIEHGAVFTFPGPVFGNTDSTGAVRLTLRSAGRYAVRAQGFGYDPWNGDVTVTDSTGVALIVQLRRTKQPIVPVVVR